VSDRGGRSRAALTLVAALAIVGACRLPRESPPSRYWMLTPLDVDVSAGAHAERTLGVGPTELPSYLDRAGVVTRSGARLDVAPYDLWGQPLAETVTQVLGTNLERLLPGTTVELFPWKVATRDLDRRLAIQVERFEADADGAVHLDASWDLRSGAAAQVLSSGRASIRETVPEGGGAEPVVAAMSRALAQLSREIASQMAAK